MTGMQRCRRPVGETPLQRKFGFLISTCAHSSQRCLTSPEPARSSPEVKGVNIHSASVLVFSYCMCLRCENELPQQLQFISHNQLVPLFRNVHAETYISEPTICDVTKRIHTSVRLELSPPARLFVPPSETTLWLPPWPFSKHQEDATRHQFSQERCGRLQTEG